MQHVINGRVVELYTDPDGAVESDTLRRAAGIGEDRTLVLQTPGGGNVVVNPGTKLHVKPDQMFTDIPAHKRGR